MAIFNHCSVEYPYCYFCYDFLSVMRKDIAPCMPDVLKCMDEFKKYHNSNEEWIFWPSELNDYFFEDVIWRTTSKFGDFVESFLKENHKIGEIWRCLGMNFNDSFLFFTM